MDRPGTPVSLILRQRPWNDIFNDYSVIATEDWLRAGMHRRSGLPGSGNFEVRSMRVGLAVGPATDCVNPLLARFHTAVVQDRWPRHRDRPLALSRKRFCPHRQALGRRTHPAAIGRCSRLSKHWKTSVAFIRSLDPHRLSRRIAKQTEEARGFCVERSRAQPKRPNRIYGAK